MASRKRAANGEFAQSVPGYEIECLLGSGGMSTVYRARQLSLQRTVALKVIRKDQLDQSTPLQRLTKEAHLLAKLDHPHLLRSIDFGETEEILYFAMEFVDGDSARDHITRHGPMPVRDALLVIDRVTAALEHAAQQGIIHRDVKPSNILLGKDGSVKLGDFGLARASLDRSLTRDGATVGTPQYMAPEQVRSSKRADSRSDLYSVGATLYFLVTGRPPFNGESVAEVLHEVLYGRPVPPEQVLAEIPRALSRVIARLMARNPARRYQSGEALRADLQRVRQLLQPRARPDTEPIGLSWQEAAEPESRVAVRAGIAVGAVALVLLGAALGFTLLGGSGGDAIGEKRAAEEKILVDLEASVESRGGALRVLVRLDQLLADGSLSTVSSVDRLRLAELAEVHLLEQIEAAANEAMAEVRRQLCRDTPLTQARTALEESMDARLPAQLGQPGPVLLQAWAGPIAAARERLLAPHRKFLDQLELDAQRAVEGAVQDALQAARSELEGESGAEGLLARYALTQAEELVREFRGRTEAQALAAFTVPMERVGPSRATSTFASMCRMLGESGDRLRQAIDAGQASLDEALDAARIRREAEFVELVNSRRERDAIWLSASGSSRTPESLEEELRHQLDQRVGGAGALSPAMQAALADYRLATQQAFEQEQRREAEDRRRRWISGGDGQPGVHALLLDWRTEEALQVLELARQVDAGPEVATWFEVVTEIDRFLRRAAAGIEQRSGKTVEWRTSRGLLLGGVLNYSHATGKFEIGRARDLSVRDLTYDTLHSLAQGPEPAARVQAALRFYIDSRREGLDEVLAAAPGGPVVDFLRNERDEERRVSEMAEAEREAEAQHLATAIVERLAAGRFHEAEEPLASLRRMRGTRAYREFRTRLDEFDEQIRRGKQRAAALSHLRATYANAVDFRVLEDQRILLHYDFEQASALEDFENTGLGVRVRDGALVFERVDERRDLVTALFGPRLPLPLDLQRAFELTLSVVTSVDEEAPHLVGLYLGGLSVAFFRPIEPVGEVLEPQLSAWEGLLDEFRDYFYTPVLSTARSVRGRSVSVGLMRGARHEITVRWDPEAEELDVLLDGATVYRLEARRRKKPAPAYFEFRTASPLGVESFRFVGSLEG